MIWGSKINMRVKILSFILLFILIFWLVHNFKINFSNSMPIGIYKLVKKNNIERYDLVAVKIKSRYY